MDTRKRKRILIISPQKHCCLFPIRAAALLLCFSFFPFLLFLSHHQEQDDDLATSPNPIRILPLLPRKQPPLPPKMRILKRVSFPYSVLLIVGMEKKVIQHRQLLSKEDIIECTYHHHHHQSFNNSDDVRPVVSTDEYGEFWWIVQCPAPNTNSSAVVGLRWRRGEDWRGLRWHRGEDWGGRRGGEVLHQWDMVTYEAVRDDGDGTVVLFVKGLNLRPDRESDPSPFTCRFELEGGGNDHVWTSKAITAAQEVIRCALPNDVKEKIGEGGRVGITVGATSRVRGRGSLPVVMPSVAEISGEGLREGKRKGNGKYELCACTMVWNQASAIREWIMYHAWLGVERWFVYDNNSDDDLRDVIEELDEENYNVTRHAWPWIKSQEAGFSHCALRARDECSWVVFFDVDEFFYFPPPRHRGDSAIASPGQNTLRELVGNISLSSAIVAEMRTTCYSFGPSGLRSVPVQGVTTGYTCRLQSPERHKSIVRPDALDDTLLNAVHHFRLKKEFRYLNMPPGTILINHYKYQVWESFKAKFHRRVSTYVADWQENQNEGSRDRAPGLGTEAIEPPNWHLKFCEVWDTGLRDFVMANLADRVTGLLPWQSSAVQ